MVLTVCGHVVVRVPYWDNSMEIEVGVVLVIKWAGLKIFRLYISHNPTIL